MSDANDYLSRLSFGFFRRLPVILQTEAAECGLAYLVSVLGFSGSLQASFYPISAEQAFL